MEFSAGLVLGAILGVVVDRLFTYFVEKRVYIKIQASYVQNIDKGIGFSLKVTNVGVEMFPPYKIALYNPHRGTLFFFEHEQQTDRLPGQTDVFTVWQNFLSRRQEHMLSYFTKSIPRGVTQGPSPIPMAEMKPEEFRNWFLRLVLVDSENKVLYQNNSVGVAVAEIMRNALQTGQLNPTGEQMSRIHVTTGLLARWREWRESRRTRKELWVHVRVCRVSCGGGQGAADS